uniref:185/333 D1 alpha n=1 Tax=Strongylocentrotus purpuratus TaxID=7668 RepID=A6N463_STRPU|nr:185/333 D1 alpha [Strongylocentrotus purpuratus]
MVKVTLIVAIVAALAISAHAQRDYNELRGNKNGRERGQGRFGGRPGGMQMGGSRQDGGPMGGRRFDGPDSGAPQMDGRRQDGGPMGGRRFDGPGFGAPEMDGRRQNGGPMGGRRFDGPGFGGSRPVGAGGRPFFGQGGRRGDEEEETDAAQQIGDGLGGPGQFDGPGRRHHGHRQGHPQDQAEEQPFGQRNESSEEDGRPHPHHHRHHGHHHRHHNHTEGHQGHNETGDQDQDKLHDTRPFRYNHFGRKPFGDRPFGRRNHTEGHQGHNETGDHPHRHHNKTRDGDQDRPMFEMRPFRFNPFGRKPFGGRPFDRRNGTEEGSPRRDGHRRPYGNRGRWGENESEEKEHPTTDGVTTSSPPEVVAINEEDINVVAEV